MSTNIIAISPFTMPAALAAGDATFGSPTWHGDPGNPDQIAWLESFRRRASLAERMPEIRANATDDAKNHASWLSAQGWQAQVTQGIPGDVFLAATLNVAAKWREAGRAYKDGVDRVLLRSHAAMSPQRDGENPAVEVLTQHESFSFHFQQVDRAPGGPGELMELARGIALRSAPERVHLDFPTVDLRARSEAGYMLGLRSGQNVVTQAAEQFRLELNEIGGRASAAAEVAVTRSMSAPQPRLVRIEGPFVVAVVDHHLPMDDVVVFAAYCDESVWRRPAEGRI